MRYKPYYSDILLLSSVFYFNCALIDFIITESAYFKYGDLFFQMEMNPLICNLLKMGIPPIHIVVIPFIVLLLSAYVRELANEITTYHVIKDWSIWGMGFCTCIITMMGILHLLGFISWFYHGGF